MTPNHGPSVVDPVSQVSGFAKPFSARPRRRRGGSLLLALAMGVGGWGCGTNIPVDGDAAQRQPATAPRGAGAGAGSAATMSASGREYLPLYSHIYTRDGEAEDLSATLSIRNISDRSEIVVDEVRYYDTQGKLVETYLDEPAVLGPLETLEFFVPSKDQRGGSGANAIVRWHAPTPVMRPLVEAVMVRTSVASRAFAFSTRAVPMRGDEGVQESATSTD